MLAIIAVLFLTWLVFGYFSYGRWVAKQFELDDSREKIPPINVAAAKVNW